MILDVVNVTRTIRRMKKKEEKKKRQATIRMEPNNKRRFDKIFNSHSYLKWSTAEFFLLIVFFLCLHFLDTEIELFIGH